MQRWSLMSFCSTLVHSGLLFKLKSIGVGVSDCFLIVFWTVVAVQRPSRWLHPRRLFFYPLNGTEHGSQPSMTTRDRKLVSVLEVRIEPGDLNPRPLTLQSVTQPTQPRAGVLSAIHFYRVPLRTYMQRVWLMVLRVSGSSNCRHATGKCVGSSFIYSIYQWNVWVGWEQPPSGQ